MDFQNFIDIEYQTIDDEVTPIISKIDLDGIINKYCKEQANGDEFKKYCIDRILRYSDLEAPESWKINLRKFYYGEELDSIHFKNYLELCDDISKISDSSSTTNKMNYVLSHEYGYFLKCIQNFDWAISEIPYNSIEIKCPNHFENLNKSAISRYKNWELPRCVVIKLKEDTYRIIDGYHRYAACNHDNIKVILGQ